MPAFDQVYSALINDLDAQGLLDETLVMVSSEFGRTPKINGNAGRDHWPKVFSVVLAGGGITRGAIYGTSNATASEPEANPLDPADLATTVYNQLGIVADKELVAYHVEATHDFSILLHSAHGDRGVAVRADSLVDARIDRPSSQPLARLNHSLWSTARH